MIDHHECLLHWVNMHTLACQKFELVCCQISTEKSCLQCFSFSSANTQWFIQWKMGICHVSKQNISWIWNWIQCSLDGMFTVFGCWQKVELETQIVGEECLMLLMDSLSELVPLSTSSLRPRHKFSLSWGNTSSKWSWTLEAGSVSVCDSSKTWHNSWAIGTTKLPVRKQTRRNSALCDRLIFNTLMGKILD